MQRSFQYGNATITVHRRRTADRLDSEMILALLTADVDRDSKTGFMRRWHRAKSYAVMLVSIDAVDGDPGFPIPTPDAPEAELRAGLAAFLADDGFYEAWEAAIIAVNAPIGDPDTAPGVDDLPNA